MHFIGVGLRLSQAADSAEVSYAVASMTISIDAKCYYVLLVFIRSRSTWEPLSQGLWVSAITSAVDSAEVSTHAMALLSSFCFSAAFLFELVSMLGH